MAPKPDPARTLDQLVCNRRALQSSLTVLQLQVTSDSVKSFNYLVASDYLDQLTELRSALKEIQDDISPLCTETGSYDKHDAVYGKMLTELQGLINLVKALDVLQPKSSPPAAGGGSSSSNNSSRPWMKLPPMTLPNFDGNLQTWVSFYDRFKSAVHDNAEIPRAMKLQYLKSSLQGDAASLISTIQVTNDNYQRAWDAVIARYERKRTLMNHQVRRLFTQPPLTVESAVGLRTLIDTTVECIEQLKIHGQIFDNWDLILVYLVAERLDSESRKQWELTLTEDQLPTFVQLQTWVNARATALACINSVPIKPKSQGTSSDQGHSSGKGRQTAQVNNVSTSQFKCLACDGEHPIYQCEKFIGMKVQDRIAVVKQKSLCFNCLLKGHSVSKCRGGTCRKCHAKHNTLLHHNSSQQSKEKQPSVNNPPSEGAEQKKVSVKHVLTNLSGQVLLATALVTVQAADGRSIQLRALIDNGAEASLISERSVQQLGLKKQRVNVAILGIGEHQAGTATKAVSLTIGSRSGQFSLSLEAYVFPTISKYHPKYSVSNFDWPHIEGLELADPSWHHPSRIDLLLGADVYSDIIQGGIRKGLSDVPVAVQSVFGWLLVGRLPSEAGQGSFRVNHLTTDLDATLRRFWELEAIPKVPLLTAEHKAVEAHFASTHRRDETGRYQVDLPFRQSTETLGQSRGQAVRRFQSVERRLTKDENLREQYRAFMNEYISLGHMELVPAEAVHKDPSECYYLPHHAVLKEDSLTTKLRTVFDGSAKTDTGLSLNNALMVGPKLQKDLFHILLNFRLHPIAITADIAKMYRQILVNPKHQDYQRIVWRHSPELPLRDYKLLTVTYGTSAAPYLAVKCLQQLASDHELEFPEAAKAAKEKFYVDDLMDSVCSVEQALVIQAGLIELLARGGFHLRKWASNSVEVLQALPEEMRAVHDSLTIDDDETVKTLGLRWHPSSDKFTFKVSVEAVSHPVTKRTMLSAVAKVFDPLGSLSPTTIVAKLLIQRLWQESYDWDTPVSPEVLQLWEHYQQQMKTIELIDIPRCVIPAGAVSTQLHGFADASEKAFAACVYFRSVMQDGSVTVHLVTSKSNVAPKQQVSLPRLELCAAYSLCQLIESITTNISINFEAIHCWSDSKVVLDWLASEPSRWKTFVANRVSQIQDIVPSSNWHHVPGEDNPADCASRGISPSELLMHPLWWHGPPWLSEPVIQFNRSITSASPNESVNVKLEEKSSESKLINVVHPHPVVDYSDYINRCSSLWTIRRVTAYILRWQYNFKNPDNKRSGPIRVSELQVALLCWVKLVQQIVFATELKALRDKKTGPLKSSRLLSLNPFIDSEGFLRVGGRLGNSDLPHNQKHPILLPQKHRLTYLILRYEHLRNLHAGGQLLLATIQQQFWILNGREIVQGVVRKCARCVRLQAATATQMMSDLPAARVNQARPFKRVGVDYAGPISLRVIKGRGHKFFKGYIAIFVCFTTRAIHLELVSDLSSEAFIQALKRFVGRRGKPSDIFSDNGTNFVGADHEMHLVFRLVQADSHTKLVSKFLSNMDITWHFNPAGAPHFGGLWEAGVSSMKKHLRATVGNHTLTFEEMCTVLCQIEACLNSRPLYPLSGRPDDLLALTPGHFLTGAPLNAVLEEDFTSDNLRGPKRWQEVERIHQDFWRRWRSEFLSRLQQRPKWCRSKENIQVGDLVLIKDENQPPLKWKMGRVLKVHPGSDNLVRAVTLRTGPKDSDTIQRPIVKLCPLPMNCDSV